MSCNDTWHNRGKFCPGTILPRLHILSGSNVHYYQFITIAQKSSKVKYNSQKKAAVRNVFATRKFTKMRLRSGRWGNLSRSSGPPSMASGSPLSAPSAPQLLAPSRAPHAARHQNRKYIYLRKYDKSEISPKFQRQTWVFDHSKIDDRQAEIAVESCRPNTCIAETIHITAVILISTASLGFTTMEFEKRCQQVIAIPSN